MKLPANSKHYLTALILIIFSFTFNSCLENFLSPDHEHVDHFKDELWTVSSDGTDPKKIADNAKPGTFLSRSNKIIYQQGTDISAINLDGSGQVTIRKFDYERDFWNIENIKFSYSPDYSKILMAVEVGGLFELNTRSLGLFPMLKTDHPAYYAGRIEYPPVNSACYSEDMTKIVYQDESGIKIISASVSAVDTPVTIIRPNDYPRIASPAFAFKDTQVIYQIQSYNYPNPGQLTLHSYNLKTLTDLLLISHNQIPLNGDHFEVIAGNRIVCTVLENNKYYIKVVSLAENSIPVTLGEGQNFSMSPDRSKVLIYDDKSFSIVNIDGSGSHLVYTETGNKVKLGVPALSFDGQHIIFGRNVYEGNY